MPCYGKVSRGGAGLRQGQEKREKQVDLTSSVMFHQVELDGTSSVIVASCIRMPKAHPLFLEIASQLRALADDPETTWSFYTHAEEEMVEAGLDHNDAYHLLQNAKITDGDAEGNDRRYRVEEFTKDGIHAGFIVTFSSEEKWIEIITAFRVRE